MTMTIEQFTAALASGKHAFPGGYETHFIMADCEPMCFDCADKEQSRILEEIASDYPEREWQPIEQAVHWEGEPLTCAHCNRDIESEYGN